MAEIDDQPASDLPDIESLDKDSDYTSFMRDGVPENLRRQALNKLWRNDPVFAHIDGLDDYDDDFTKLFPKAVSKAVKIAHKAGKDLLAPTDEGTKPASASGDAASDAASDDEGAETRPADDGDTVTPRPTTGAPKKPA